MRQHAEDRPFRLDQKPRLGPVPYISSQFRISTLQIIAETPGSYRRFVQNLLFSGAGCSDTIRVNAGRASHLSTIPEYGRDPPAPDRPKRTVKSRTRHEFAADGWNGSCRSGNAFCLQERTGTHWRSSRGLFLPYPNRGPNGIQASQGDNRDSPALILCSPWPCSPLPNVPQYIRRAGGSARSVQPAALLPRT